MSAKHPHHPNIDPKVKLAEATRLQKLAEQQEHDAIKIALRSTDGNVRRAAKLLGMKHRTLDKRLREGCYRDLYKETSRQPGRPSSNSK